MRTTIAKWGNSLAVRIPKGLVELSGWCEGDTLEFNKMAEIIVLKKVRKIKRYELGEILGSFQTAQDDPYIDWGKPQGQEVW